jgi:hypothetical protein
VYVDGHRHLAYTKLLAEEKATTYNCFMIRAAGWLERLGGTITLVMTDNGNDYR